MNYWENRVAKWFHVLDKCLQLNCSPVNIFCIIMEEIYDTFLSLVLASNFVIAMNTLMFYLFLMMNNGMILILKAKITEKEKLVADTEEILKKEQAERWIAPFWIYELVSLYWLYFTCFLAHINSCDSNWNLFIQLATDNVFNRHTIPGKASHASKFLVVWIPSLDTLSFIFAKFRILFKTHY